jgi:AcrR family transcriptional regulator
MFLRDGYAATSLERVADEAGFSKGAVYSNFAGKDDLCLAVLDSIHEEVAGAVLGSVEGAPTVEDALRSFDSWAESRLGDPEWSALEAEFSARSRRDPRLRAALAQRNLRLRDTIAAALTRTAQEHGITLPLPVEGLATALLSIGIGIGVQRSLDHDVPVRVLSDVVRALAGLPLPDNRFVPDSGPLA